MTQEAVLCNKQTDTGFPRQTRDDTAPSERKKVAHAMSSRLSSAAKEGIISSDCRNIMLPVDNNKKADKIITLVTLGSSFDRTALFVLTPLRRSFYLPRGAGR